MIREQSVKLWCQRQRTGAWEMLAMRWDVRSYKWNTNDEMGIFYIYPCSKCTVRNAPKSRTRKMKIHCKELDKRPRKTRLFTTKEVCRCKYAKMKPSYQAPVEQDVTPPKNLFPMACDWVLFGCWLGIKGVSNKYETDCVYALNTTP